MNRSRTIARIAWTSLLAMPLVACEPRVSPQFEQEISTGTVYLCCNFHHFGDVATDANWYVDSFIPAGTTVDFREFGGGYVEIAAAGRIVWLYHKYGVEQETQEQFFSKLFVRTDPRPRIEALPEPVRRAVEESRVEPGMTREEVLLSVGYPPTHETPSLDAEGWKLWYNRWHTYQVTFGPEGRVTKIKPQVEGEAPTTYTAVR